MNSLKRIAATVFALTLAACGGGGGDAGSSPFGSGTGSGTVCTVVGAASSASGVSSACVGSTATSVDVLTSSTTINSGGDTATITAVVKGPGNVGLSGASVTFSADSGNLTGASSTTDASGTAKATFTAGSDRSNRTIRITVSAGSVAGSVSLDVIGTKITYNGATTIPLAGTASLPVTVVDARGAPIAGLALAVTSSLNNGLSAASVVTNALGVATVDYTATNPGADTVKFSGAGTTVPQVIQVSAANFAFETPAPSTRINVSTSQPVTVRYLVGGSPQVGQTINFSTTAGSLSSNSAATDSTGRATVNLSSATASPAVVQATVSGAQASVPVVFVATVPSSIILQVTPASIAPNATGSVTQQAAVLATVRDATGNPVSGAIVSFTRVVDPSGGTLSQPSQPTDLNGQATVQYISGAIATASNGVQIRGAVVGSSVSTCAAAASACTSGRDAALTVSQSALFIALGTGNEITNLDPQTYRKDYTVYVTDANGVPVPNVSLTIKALPTLYRKGTLIYDGAAWVYATGVVTCANEDANYNGVLDAGEDINADGRLQPGNVISVTTAISTTPGSSGIAKTDASGRATITLLYAESYVPWVQIRLVAQAVVSGTESSTDATFFPPGVASDFTSSTNPPAGTTSPFGVGACTTRP